MRFTILGELQTRNYGVSFETYQAMPVGACLVAISNLDWVAAVRIRMHGNTIDFDAPYTVFGYVQSSNLVIKAVTATSVATLGAAA